MSIEEKWILKRPLYSFLLNINEHAEKYLALNVGRKYNIESCIRNQEMNYQYTEIVEYCFVVVVSTFSDMFIIIFYTRVRNKAISKIL